LSGLRRQRQSLTLVPLSAHHRTPFAFVRVRLVEKGSLVVAVCRDW
jgi:hypothetical protein